jgi:hypothetical protein
MGGWVGFGNAFEEAGILRELTGILDNINSMLVIAERYRLPSALIRTFIYDGVSGLDASAREYRGYVGKVMDYVCEELRGLLYEALEGGRGLRG